MSLSFPIPAADFANAFPIKSVEFDTIEFVDQQGARRGDVTTSVLALPRWRASITMGPLDSRTDAAKAKALMRRIGSTNYFNVYDPQHPFPRHDQDGTEIGDRTVRVLAISGRSMKFSNLPADYNLHPGDKFTIHYGANPTRKAFLEIAQFASTNGDGDINIFVDVNPYIPLGVHVNDVCDFRKPSCLMKFTSRSIGNAVGEWTHDISFEAIEARRT